MKIADRRKDLRPREKLHSKGSESLTDLELLMAIIGSGNKQADVTKIARDVLKKIKEKGSALTLKDLLDVKGLGTAKSTNIMAGYELWRRHFEDKTQPIIDSPDRAAEVLKSLADKKQEYFVCLTLDGANRLINNRTITIGTLTSSLVHPREVFADAIVDRAASIIVAHNHPSGNLQPSQADLDVTERLRSSAELLGIKLNDHLIITKNGFNSIA